MTKRKLARTCAPWVLCALATACMDRPLENEWRKVADEAMAVYSPGQKRRKLLTVEEIRSLPTFSLPVVARAAALRFDARTHGARHVVMRTNLMTELERRRAKAASPAKEGV